MNKMKIQFSPPAFVGKELVYIAEAVASGSIAGGGAFTRRCQAWLEGRTGAQKALLTHSCTGALEMAALLFDIQPGDEVIMPSFTFVSTANAFVLRGAVPVFVDIRPDTLNLDEEKIEAAITSKTRAIVPVHYAGVGCEMGRIMEIAEKHGLWVVEDAAQALLSNFGDKPLGSIGHLGCFSFHETKNVIAGEGGALLINDPNLTERAEILWEKGTDRRKFFRGEVNKYTWRDVGSSFLPSEITAAFLLAQLEAADQIIDRRLSIFQTYYSKLSPLADHGLISLPGIGEKGCGNGHIFYLLVENPETRMQLIEFLRQMGSEAVFHYVPLHDSPAGVRFGRASGDLTVTNSVWACLVRLPIFYTMTQSEIDAVVAAVFEFFKVDRSPHVAC